jgi:hypothetical protein
MSIRSAVILCRDKVSQSIEVSAPKEKSAYAKEAEFALTVLSEAMEDYEDCAETGLGWDEPSIILPNPTEMDGVSVDENPEDETKEERMEKERSRGFFG